MRKVNTKLERATCKHLARLCEKSPPVSDAVAMHEKAKARYRALVATGDGSESSGAIIADHVAYTNAIARYAALRGVYLKEIR